MNDFLPKGYSPPESDLRFMTLEEGINTVRILSPAIVGYKWWIETDDNTHVPRRVRTEAEVPEEVRNAIDPRARAKHFWAMSVYNYATQTIQVLEIRQQTIMRALDALVRSPKWGSPEKYDLVIEKVKTGAREMDVAYHVFPEPPSPLDAGILELARQVPVRLEALYEGEDPFAAKAAEERGEEPSNGQGRGQGRRAARIYS